jgi:hypothetical protein
MDIPDFSVPQVPMRPVFDDTLIAERVTIDR